MRKIAQGVYLFEELRGCNVYLLVSDAGLTLVDTGLAGDARRIVAQIEKAGLDPSELQSIVVTHAHADHIGGLAGLVQRFDSDVMAHQLEAPFIEGTNKLPTRTKLQRAMTWLGDCFPGGNKGTKVTRQLEDGERLDVLDGLRVIHTPGHTPGSLCLLQEEGGILFCGDLLFNGHPLTGRGGLRYAPQAFSVDPDEVPRSAQKLAQVTVKALCMGHGEPIVHERGVQMAELLKAMSD
jgi:glyoxylase-like metal-dependent hydrolase (beta-lactamase superfamily II)